MLKKPLSKIIIISFVLLTQMGFAEVKLMDQMSIAMGMVNNSYSQNASAFQEDDDLASGSVSVISVDFNYEFFKTRKSSHLVKLTASGLAGEASKFYGIGYGQRYYFKSEGTRGVFQSKNVTVKTSPKFRTYLGWNVLGYNLVYETSEDSGTNLRSDLGVEIGGHAGLLYGISPKKAYKVELSVGRGTGIETSSFGMQIFFGASYFVNSLF